MKICRSIQELRDLRQSHGGKTCGFVPTMGALHAGHGELLKRSRTENQISVLSIFVNPTQFNNANDLTHYPKTWESDVALAESMGVDILFAPTPEEIYHDRYQYVLQEREFSKLLCGSDREGHFDGVLTVVLKLFQLVAPTRAYFGEKDFQQLSLIEGMAKAFFLPLQIVPVPTVRESDGLAMSSRNLRLTFEERKRAPKLYEVLKSAHDLIQAREQLSQLGFKVVYLEELRGRRFVAAFLGDVRLIDNIPWPKAEGVRRG